MSKCQWLRMTDPQKKRLAGIWLWKAFGAPFLRRHTLQLLIEYRDPPKCHLYSAIREYTQQRSVLRSDVAGYSCPAENRCSVLHGFLRLRKLMFALQIFVFEWAGANSVHCHAFDHDCFSHRCLGRFMSRSHGC